MPAPVTDPEDDADPKRLRILRGLPRGTRSAEIIYKVNSRLPGGRTVRRSAAEFAVIRIDSTEGFREAEVDLDDAEQYLDDALEAAGYTDAQRRRTADAIDVTCPHCARPRHYDGTRSLITGEPGFIGGLREMTVDALVLHLYTCRTCGSTALFADDHTDHPLPGSA